ncbi:hypothetical protein [Burkholderia sp. 3C]
MNARADRLSPPAAALFDTIHDVAREQHGAVNAAVRCAARLNARADRLSQAAAALFDTIHDVTRERRGGLNAASDATRD